MSEEFEEISKNKVVTTAKLAIGEAFRGKLTGLETSSKYEDKQNLLMEDANGAPFTVFTSGTLNYAVQDGLLEVGQTYRITRLESKATKNGSRTQFKIERLRSNGSVAAPGVNNAKPAGKSAASK